MENNEIDLTWSAIWAMLKWGVFIALLPALGFLLFTILVGSFKAVFWLFYLITG